MKGQELPGQSEVMDALRADPSPEAAKIALEWLWRHQASGLVFNVQDEVVKATAQAYRITPFRVKSLLALPLQDLRRGLRVQTQTGELLPCVEPFPEHGWLGAWRLYTQGGEAPVGFSFWAGMATLSAAMRRNFYWDMGKYYLYPNQYLILLGPSGLKKTTSCEASFNVLHRLNSELSKDGKLIAHQLFVSPQRITPERLVAKMAALRGFDLAAQMRGESAVKQMDAVGLIAADEVVTLLGKNVKGADRFIHFLTAVYGCPRKYETGTVTHDDKVLVNLGLSVLFGSTEEWVRTSVTEDMFGGGFLARFILVHRTLRDRKVAIPEPLDPVLESSLAEWLVPWSVMPYPIELVRTPAATKWYKDWYERQEPEKADEREAGFANRKHDHLHKVAGLLRLSELIGPETDPHEMAASGQIAVSEEHFHQALAMIEFEQEKWPALFAAVGANEDARTVEYVAQQLVRMQGAQPRRSWFPLSLLMRKVRGRVGGRNRMITVLQTLETEGRVEVKWGKPATVRLVPAEEIAKREDDL